jgi:hypothetical protein
VCLGRRGLHRSQLLYFLAHYSKIPSFHYSASSYQSVYSRPAAAGPGGGLTYNFKSSEPQNPQKAQKNIIRVVRAIRMLTSYSQLADTY